MVGLLLIVLSFASAQSIRPLGTYGIDVDQMSVSGMSSGASMATQMHVAYSGKMKGVGMFAGTPYWCASGSLATSVGACMMWPSQINIPAILTQTQSYVNSGDIDSTTNLINDKIFLFHGTRDDVIDPGVLSRVLQFYENYVPSENIRIVSNIPAAHAMPTSHYGPACNAERWPYINNCGYDGAYEMLNFILDGELQPPVYGPNPPGDFYIFDQREFFYLHPSLSHMDTEGYVYVPTGCLNTDKEDQGKAQCRLHVVFHGCSQGKQALGDEYARHTGYNEVGEANNIIMLYPQAVSSLFSNPNGCWDWWGYNTPEVYATQQGHQALATCRMIQKITGGTGTPCP